MNISFLQIAGSNFLVDKLLLPHVSTDISSTLNEEKNKEHCLLLRRAAVADTAANYTANLRTMKLEKNNVWDNDIFLVPHDENVQATWTAVRFCVVMETHSESNSILTVCWLSAWRKQTDMCAASYQFELLLTTCYFYVLMFKF